MRGSYEVEGCKGVDTTWTRESKVSMKRRELRRLSKQGLKERIGTRRRRGVRLGEEAVMFAN